MHEPGNTMNEPGNTNLPRPPITLSDVLYHRFPQSPKINEFITRHGCPHWYFDIPYNTDCWSMTCAECWKRAIPCPLRYK